MEVRLTGSAPESAGWGVLECYERGRRTRRAPPLPVQGPPAVRDDLWASFSLQLSGDRVSELRFEAACCTTLLAYCQAAVDLATGRTLDELAALDGQSLTASLRGVPLLRQDRAAIAAVAVRGAAAAAAQLENSQPE